MKYAKLIVGTAALLVLSIGTAAAAIMPPETMVKIAYAMVG